MKVHGNDWALLMFCASREKNSIPVFLHIRLVSVTGLFNCPDWLTSFREVHFGGRWYRCLYLEESGGMYRLLEDIPME